VQLRGQWLLRVAGICKFLMGKRSFVPFIAHYCTVVRAERLNHAIIASTQANRSC
jgi:hypothetical protein